MPIQKEVVFVGLRVAYCQVSVRQKPLFGMQNFFGFRIESESVVIEEAPDGFQHGIVTSLLLLG